MDSSYIEISRLMLLAAPHVFRAPDFAMKGGTVLNLFLHDMPRLSVDIDIAFIDHTKSRDEALQTIRQELQSLCERIEPLGLKGTLASTGDSEDVKIIITRGAVSMKVEVNYNFRGTLLPPRDARISELARRSFAMDFSIARQEGTLRRQARRSPRPPTPEGFLRCARNVSQEPFRYEGCRLLCLLPCRPQQHGTRSDLFQRQKFLCHLRGAIYGHDNKTRLARRTATSSL